MQKIERIEGCMQKMKSFFCFSSVDTFCLVCLGFFLFLVFGGFCLFGFWGLGLLVSVCFFVVVFSP